MRREVKHHLFVRFCTILMRMVHTIEHIMSSFFIYILIVVNSHSLFLQEHQKVIPCLSSKGCLAFHQIENETNWQTFFFDFFESKIVLTFYEMNESQKIAISGWLLGIVTVIR